MTRQLIAIARATSAETLRQPVHGVIVAVTLLAYALSPSIAMFSFGDDLNLLKDFGVSTLFVSGLLLVAFGVSSTVGRELELSTAQTLLSKPVGRGAFLVGKLLGVLSATLSSAYLFLIALLLAARVRPPEHAHEPVDWPAVTAAFGASLAALLGGFARSLKSPADFGRAALRAACVSFTFALLLPALFAPDWSLRPSLGWIDPLVLEACALAAAGIALLGAVSVLLAVVLRRNALPAALAIFGIGLVLGPDFTLGWLLPDLQLFWVGEAFYRPGAHLPFGYLAGAAGYAAAYGIAMLGAATWLLERSEG